MTGSLTPDKEKTKKEERVKRHYNKKSKRRMGWLFRKLKERGWDISFHKDLEK